MIVLDALAVCLWTFSAVVWAVGGEPAPAWMAALMSGVLALHHLVAVVAK